MFICGCDSKITIPTPDDNQTENPKDEEKPQEPEKPTEPEEPADPQLLTGSIIGTQYSVDYTTNAKTTTVNTKENVFDGNYETYLPHMTVHRHG